MIRKGIKIFFVILFMSLIFLFSSDNGEESNVKSDGLIIHTIEFVLGRKLNTKEKELYVEKYSFWVRKMAHFTIYFLLGISFISLLYEYGILNYRAVGYTLTFVFLYACSDEIHQLFSDGRSFQIMDILIDSVGGFIGSNLYYLFRRKML